MTLAFAPTLLAAATPSAGGAATSDIIIATVGAVVVSVVMLTPILLYKAGRFPALRSLAGVAERVSGMPGWSALPGTFLVGALMIAVFGMYWDISLHLDNGRDPGPLANGAHYFILAGLFGVLLAGVLGMALPQGRPRTAIKVAPGWFAPIGAVMIAVCGSFSLIAFPLDDIWHRLFGQDVTLWGPTHLMLIGGAALSILGAWALHVEGVADAVRATAWARWREIALAGAFLIGLSTFQAEFDFGVPQFRLVLQPILLMLAASVALVTARIRLGRGGALLGLLSFLGIRALLAVLVGPILGQETPHFPLYVAEALVVEAVALFFRARPVAARPIAFGAWAGLGVGTFGLAGEWAWSHIWVVNSWPASLLPEAAILGAITAVGGGVLGGFVGRCLTPQEQRVERAPRWAVPVAALAVVAVIGYSLPASAGDGRTRATLALTDVQGGAQRAVNATIRLQPPDAAEAAQWFNVTAWQGHEGPSTIEKLVRTGPGTYRTTEPVDVHGSWKAILRLARGREVLGLPIFLPRDSAIPAPEVPAKPELSRAFVLDKRNLQREQKPGISPYLTLGAYLIVLVVYIVVLGLIAWGLRRLESRLRGPGAAEPEPPAARAAAGGMRPSTA